MLHFIYNWEIKAKEGQLLEREIFKGVLQLLIFQLKRSMARAHELDFSVDLEMLPETDFSPFEQCLFLLNNLGK